jgi:hypothetical protein
VFSVVYEIHFLNNIQLKYGFIKLKEIRLKPKLESDMNEIQDLNSKTKS